MRLGKFTIKRGSEYYILLPNVWTIGWGNTYHHGYFWTCFKGTINDMLGRR